MKRQHDAKDSLAMLPWFPRDWRASNKRATMSPLARLAYLELLFAAWLEPDCSLPADDAHLAALAGLPLTQWSKIGPEVAPAFERGPDGRLRSLRLTKEHVYSIEQRDQRRVASKKANGARWKRLRDGSATESATDPERIPCSRIPIGSPASAATYVGETRERVGVVYSGDGQTAPDPSPPPDPPEHHDGERRKEGDEYVRLVWDAFGEKRGPALHRLGQMSSAEWELARGWRESGVPLRVVLQAIEQCDVSKARSLLYLRPAVEQEAARVAAAMYS